MVLVSWTLWLSFSWLATWNCHFVFSPFLIHFLQKFKKKWLCDCVSCSNQFFFSNISIFSFIWFVCVLYVILRVLMWIICKQTLPGLLFSFDFRYEQRQNEAFYFNDIMKSSKLKFFSRSIWNTAQLFFQLQIVFVFLKSYVFFYGCRCQVTPH